MNESRDQLVKWLYVQVDLLAIVLAWIGAYYLRFYGPLPVTKGIPEGAVYFKLLPFIVIIWLVVFNLGGLYRRSGRPRAPLFEGLDILQLSLLALLSFIAVTYFYEEYRYSRLTLLFFALLHPFFIVMNRSLLRKGLRVYRRSSPPRKVLLVGGGEAMRRAFRITHSLGLTASEIVGWVSLGGDHDDDEGLSKQLSCPKFPVPDDWSLFFAKHPCETVIIAPPKEDVSFLDRHLEKMTEFVVDIKVVPDLSPLSRFASGIEIIDNIALAHIHDSPLKGVGHIKKRILDLVVATGSLLVFGPFMLLIAGLIKLSSRGPVLYKQERMGLDGKVFSIFKFRTMPLDSEQRTGAVWAHKNDRRATLVGSFLRRSSLDELPQLFNVVRGEMSLIGPRPERPVFVERFRKDVPGYMLRHKVKAGMTGWAQVKGWRGNTSIEKRIECDLFYIQNWSVWFDIKILFLTLFRGFLNPNAY